MSTKVRLAVLLAASLALTACGGGGGGGSTPPPPPPPPVVVPTSITVGASIPAQGAVDVAVNQVVSVAYTIAGTAAVFDSTSTTLTCAGTQVAIGTNVAGAIQFVRVADMPHNTTCTASGTVTASGQSGKASAQVNFTFTTVAPPVLRYDQVTVGVYSGNPAIITDTVTTTGPVLARNLSLATLGPVGKCLIGEEPLADGMFPELCAANDGKFHQMLHDVVDNTIIEYKGALPLGYEFMLMPDGLSVGPKWHACMRFCGTGDWRVPPKSYMAVWAAAKSGGYYFTADPDNRILQKIDSVGNITKVWQDLNGNAFVVMTTISH